ncbi:hypothetical protein FH609_015190 [Streptomyces sp. 3MP-14]|uniref:Syntaxin-5 N-terminal Sly1p-binding domain-containing protein n=1 Tax=Streptomyces mimosae TaxID=2586635 RepID=A0A5N6AAQ2_9ACTN|nr:hypothetical protein FH607_012515 [Streptomyces mimosae]KAB8176293.1 hypothetical protein FH609_015190 [Streptomyces sp. 3MP-14]
MADSVACRAESRDRTNEFQQPTCTTEASGSMLSV